VVRVVVEFPLRIRQQRRFRPARGIPPVSSFGEELRRERELRQITLREIAEATKISLRYLDALERNDFRSLPGGVFNKGFVRAYSQYIGVDPEAMVNAYLLEARGQHAVSADAPSPDVFRPHTGLPPRSTVQTQEPNPARWPPVVAGAVVVIAVGALAAWWWTTQRSPEGPSEPVANGRAATGSPEGEPQASDADSPGSTSVETELPVAAGVVPPQQPQILEPAPESTTEPGAGNSQIRIVLQRPTQGRLNCDNRRVEILDGMSVGSELVFTCREFLRVDALDGGALLVQRGRDEAESLAPDGVPVVSRYLVPPRAEEPS
jgi:cytoskeletal protein RodZ